MLNPRPYQDSAILKTESLWEQGFQRVTPVSPTGSGKTLILAELNRRDRARGGYTGLVAHRTELIEQISVALARQGVMHDILTKNNQLIRFISERHIEETGQCFRSPNAQTFVSSVQSLLRQRVDTWAPKLTMLSIDESHHITRGSGWGKCIELFPNAKGLFPTATLCRADGKGLGSHADGYIDKYFEVIGMRQLIRDGNLTDYRIYAPPTNIDLSNMGYGSDGDFNKNELRKRNQKAQKGIIGDVVQNYVKYANGTQAVVFVVDVETSRKTADELNANGIKAISLDGTTDAAVRRNELRKFANKETQVLVNVDLFGEGFDCPGIETVIMARPTMSYGLYSQQFGRSLRPLPGKSHAIIIDMVGNVKRHGLPDAPREWSLDRREKRGKSDSGSPAVKTCSECMGVYAVGPSSCPYCGHAPVVGAGGRGELVMVDAELRELTAEELADLRGESDKLSKEWNVPYGGSKVHMMAAISHNKTVGAQRELREAIALYAGAFRAMGVPDQMIHVDLAKRYGTNVSAAQVLRPKEANELRERIMNDLKSLGVGV
ncbi:coil containing protein [Vibrio phage 1.250.O._10N.261.55.E11]|nr:coil containing protein [Vibrio phage 1.250.O._10N.261.55.E11]